MAKYYAKELDGEYFDYELYFNEEGAVNYKFCAFGNRDFKELNYDLIADIVSVFESGAILTAFEDETGWDNDLSDSETDRIIIETVSDYFKKADGRQLEDEDCIRIFKLADDYIRCERDEENDVICGVLKILYGVPFKTGTIRGSSQGDWMEYICPEALSGHMIDYIEAVLFATGTEFMITEEMIDSPDQFDTVDSCSYYTTEWNNGAIKQDLAVQADISVNDLAILKITGSHTYTKYYYEEI